MVVAVGQAAKVVTIGHGKNWFGFVHGDADNANQGKPLGGGHYSNRTYVAGVFGRDSASSIAGGGALLLPPGACFAPNDKALTDSSERMYGTLETAWTGKADIVTVTSANWLHRFGLDAALALKPKSIILEKPMGLNGKEGQQMHDAVQAADIDTLLAFTYTYYPMVELAAQIVHNTDFFGTVTAFKGEYPQGWLATTDMDNADWNWRTVPEKAGESCAGGDILSHVIALQRKVTGINIGSIYGLGSTTAPGRAKHIQDYLYTLGRLENDAPFMMGAQQTARGSDNDVWFEVTGSKRSIKWSHKEPHKLHVTDDNNNWVELKAGFDAAGIPQLIKDQSTFPTGHYDGFSGGALKNMYEIAERIARGLPHIAYQGTDYGLAANLVVDGAVESSKIGRLVVFGNLPPIVKNATLQVDHSKYDQYYTPFQKQPA